MGRHDGHPIDRYGPKGPFISGFPRLNLGHAKKEKHEHTGLSKEGHW